jgi:hypothetical protein
LFILAFSAGENQEGGIVSPEDGWEGFGGSARKRASRNSMYTSEQKAGKAGELGRFSVVAAVSRGTIPTSSAVLKTGPLLCKGQKFLYEA